MESKGCHIAVAVTIASMACASSGTASQIPPNPIVSRGRPVASNVGSSGPANAVDGVYLWGPSWAPGSPTPGSPAWIAINIGGGPKRLLLNWSADGSYNYNGNTYGSPGDYIIQTSSNSTDGSNGTWSNAVTVTGNSVRTRAHSFDFTGRTWVLSHPGELSGDGVHPNDTGSTSINRLWAQAASNLYSSALIPHNGRSYYLNGANIPWNAFGIDAGSHASWGRLCNTNWFTTFFASCKQSGINSVRFWIHCDGRASPEFDLNGYVTGLDPTFLSDLESIFQIANNNNVMIIPCLWTFEMAGAVNSGAGPLAGGHADLMTDTNKTRSYIDNALIPIVQHFADTPNLLAWEIINEPEWIPESTAYQTATKSQIQRFCAMIAAAIHQNCDKMVTVGSGGIMYNSSVAPATGNWWSDAELRAQYNSPDAYLDFYQIHHYDWMIQYRNCDIFATNRPVTYWQLDKPAIIGECPALNTGVHPIREQIYNCYSNGYAGIMFWSYNSDYSGNWTATASELKAFRDTHTNIVDYVGAGIPQQPPVQAPYGGTPAVVPGRVQTENYDTGGEGLAFHETTPGNDGGAYRTDSVDIEPCADTGGGHDVGWVDAGEWLEYTVDVASTRTYDITLRVASMSADGLCHLTLGASNITGAVSIPNTGGWQTWQSVTVQGVLLPGGTGQVLRLAIDNAAFNINWINIAPASGGVPPQPQGYLDIYTDTNSLITATWAYAGTLIETTTGGPFEGIRHYSFAYNFNNWWSDASFRIRSSGSTGVNFSLYDNFQIAYRHSGAVPIAIQLFDEATGEDSNPLILTQTSTNSLISIPVNSFTGMSLTNVGVIRINYSGVPSGSGTDYFDCMRLELLQDLTPPTTPANLVAAALNSRLIALAWSASTDNRSVTGYMVYTNGTLHAVSGSPSCVCTGLTPSTVYDFTVSAFDAAGNSSGPSMSVACGTLAPDTEPPSIPRHLSARIVSSCQLSLSWSPSSDNVGVVGYRVYRNGQVVATVATTDYFDCGLAAGTRYTYQTMAFDNDGNESAMSESILSPATLTSLPRIAVSNDFFVADGRRIWMLGANTPWNNWNEFGGNYNPAWWDNHFAMFNSNGLNSSRVWITCSGEVGINIDSSGHVSGATAKHWSDLDSLFAIAQARGVYIMATLISFDHFLDSRTTYQRWRNWIASDANIDSYINNYLIPFVARYGTNTALWAIDLVNEPDWATDTEGATIPWTRFQTYWAKAAVAIHANSVVLTAVGMGVIKYNSDAQYMNGNMASDARLQARLNDPRARMDFWSPHWYEWMDPYWPQPMYVTPAAFGLDTSRPCVIGECADYGTTGHTLTQDYFAAYSNGWCGVLPWTSNIRSGRFLGWEGVQPAAKAFAAGHGTDVFPVNWNTTYRVEGIAGAGGAITPASVTVPAGGQAKFVITGETYHRVSSLSSNGSPVALNLDNSSTNVTFIWSNLQTDGTVGATFQVQVADGPGHTPYWWLASHRLTNESWNASATLDTDGDGMRNWEEYLAGCDPTNQMSLFKVLDLSFEGGIPVVTFTGSSKSGITTPFQMLRFTNMAAPGMVVDTSIPRSVTGTNVWTDLNPPPNAPLFYAPIAIGSNQ